MAGNALKTGGRVLGIGAVIAVLVYLPTNSAGDMDKDIRGLASDNFQTRHQAMDELSRAGAKAVPKLAGAIHASNAEQRRLVAALLGPCGTAAKDPSEAIAALAEMTKDPDAKVRYQAAIALGDFGAKGGPCVEALTRALSDPDREVKEGAASSLYRIGPSAAPATPALLEMLRGPDLLLVGYAAQALGSIHPDAQQVVPALTAALDRYVNHPFPSPLDAPREGARLFTVEKIADALGQFGQAAAESIPALKTAVAENNKDVHDQASAALKKIESPMVTDR